MTRGNQRELARQKNLKKQQKSKHKEEGDPRTRMESHAEIMRRKQAEADARRQESAGK